MPGEPGCQTEPVRWAALFADLEAQLDAADQAALAGEVADRSRREVAAQRVLDRLRAAVGAELVARLVSGVVVGGRLASAGPDWLLLTSSSAADALVPLAALSSLSGLPALASEPSTVGAVEARLGLAYALRGIARDRAPVVLGLTDGTTLTGTVDRVGADFVDVAEHATGEPRRTAAVREVRTVPFTSLAVIRPG
ncbi:MAG: hypothetical protein QOJ03_2566 [Frankiaceae bacterium]|jgi:hypothetical protein|nr:hypothetical protein [Frankiaceae bacterium]